MGDGPADLARSTAEGVGGFGKSHPSRLHEMTPKCIPTPFLRYSVNPSWGADADGELKSSGLRPSDRAYEDNERLMP